MKSLRFSLALLAFSLAPVYGQFAINVQQNGQSQNVSSGSTISLNTPAIGQTASAFVTITNIGTSTVVFPAAPTIVGPSDFGANGQVTTLAPFQSASVTVAYTSKAAPAETAQLFYPFNQVTATGVVTASGAVTLNLLGTAPNPVVAELNSVGSLVVLNNGATVQAPDTVVGAFSTTTFTIANTGSGPVTVNSITTTNSEFQFQSLPLLPVTINAGSQLNITLRFAPSASGARTGAMQIAFASGTFSATLTGNGLSSLLTYTLTQGTTTTPLAPLQNIVLPDTALGSQSTATIQFQNTGSSAVTVNGANISGAGFSFVNPPFFPLTLAPQQSTAITIAFNPTTPGPAQGRVAIGSDTFTLSSNGLGSTLTYSYQIGGAGSSVAAGGALSVPQIAVGQSETVQFSVVNTGTTPATLFNVSLTGGNGAFRITNLGTLPQQINANSSASFGITFTPQTSGSVSATLQVNNQTFTINGNGLGPALQFSYQIGSSSTPVAQGGTIAFPSTSFGQTSAVQVVISNTGTTTGTVANVAITGGGNAFQLGAVPQLPLQIGAGASASFPVLFMPQATGQTTAILQIDNQAFNLSGTSSNPPALPTYHFTGTTSGVSAFQQPSVGLSLDATYPVGISGTLTLSVSAANLVTDPAVQFSSGGRTVAFTIPANTLQAVFPNGGTQIQIQTGTLAESIQLTPAFNAGLVNGVSITPSSPTTLQLSVPTAAPVILGYALTARTLTSFTITFSGYSTTRYLDHLNVTFTPSTGSVLSATSFTVDLSGASRIWFQSGASSTVGGQFQVDVPFTLADTNVSAGTDLTKSVASVSLTAVNDVGTSNTVKVTLP